MKIAKIAQHIFPPLRSVHHVLTTLWNEIENAEVENCILRQASAFNSSSIRTAADEVFFLLSCFRKEKKLLSKSRANIKWVALVNCDSSSYFQRCLRALNYWRDCIEFDNRRYAVLCSLSLKVCMTRFFFESCLMGFCFVIRRMFSSKNDCKSLDLQAWGIWVRFKFVF